MMKSKFRVKAALLLIAVLLLHAVANAYVLYNSKVVRVYDEGYYIASGLEVRRMIARGEYVNTWFWREPLPRKAFALLEGVVLTMLDKIGLPDIDSMILFSNLICLLILLVSVYKIGSILYNQETGLLAAVLLSFSPAIFSQARGNMLELPLAAVVSLSLWSLLKTDNFNSLGFSLLTAAFFLLAQFTKEVAVVFIAPVFLYCSFRALSQRRQRLRRGLNFIIIVLLSLLPTAAYFLQKGNQQTMQQLLGKAWIIKMEAMEFFYYLEGFPDFYLGWALFIALVPLMLHYLVNIKRRNVFLALWLFVPMVVFSLSPNRVSRFLIPGLPAFFLLLSHELFDSLFEIRRKYAAVLIAVAVLQFTIFSFYPGFSLLPRPEFDWGLLSARQDSDVDTVRKLVDIFKTEQPYSGEAKRVVFIFNLGWHTALRYEFQLRNMPFSIVCRQQADRTEAPAPGTVNWQEYLSTADYVLDKTGDLGERGAYEDITSELVTSLKNNAQRFKKIAEFETANGDTIYVYKNIAQNIPYPAGGS